MKVCMVTGTFPDTRCGVGDYAYWLSVELKRLGIDLEIITSLNPRLVKDENLNISPAVKKWNFLGLSKLLRSIREKRPGLVHLQYPTQAYKNKLMINIFPIIFRLANPRVPLVVTIHDAKTAHLFNKLRLLTFLCCARKIILTAEEERQYLVGILPFLSPKLQVINIGTNIKVYPITPQQRNSIRSGLGVKKEEVLISHFGYMLRKKRIETIFYALRRLLDAGYSIKLIMLSDFNPEKNTYHTYLKKVVEELGLDREVIWAGYCSPREVSEHLASSDLCVEIYQDGLSLRRTSFLVPAAHGLPIVTTRPKNLPEGLKEHHNILSVGFGDVRALADSMKELIDSTELRETIGKNAKVFADRFSWEAIASKHLKLYGELT